MITVWVKQDEGLSRSICFKPVLRWIADAMAHFGITQMRVAPDLTVLPDGADGKVIVIEKPVVFSPFLEGGHQNVQWPDGEVLIPWGCLPVGTLEELQSARRILKTAILMRHMENGVDIIDPATTFIGPDVTIGQGTTVLPGVVIQGKVSIGEGCELGPFTHIRPDVEMGNGVRAGAFVELKNSVLGSGTQMAHLTYVGDSDVGERVNFGCGSVTVNYNGVDKHRTVIENDAFIGCNSNIIAPVTVHEHAFTAAGSTITESVPPGALGIARARQVNKRDWLSPKEKQKKGKVIE